MGAAFLRAANGENHHDLGLFSVGVDAPRPPRGATGLYHLAWEVGSVSDLATARKTLRLMGALSGESSHGATLSVYGVDPDGNQFEVMWMLPRSEWGVYEDHAVVMPLDLEDEIARRS
jgi:catechol-2,3-dioxygenase